MSNEETRPEEPAADQLTDELAKKYDPERLLRMLAKRAGKGESLEHSVRSRYEKKFGVDLGHVRIYSGEFAEEFNRQKGSYAVTVGGTGAILMGGSPEKTGAAGQALLAHELTHVAQQQRGLGGGLHRKGVQPMPFAEEHEQEAEAVEQAEHHEAQGGSSEALHSAEHAKATAEAHAMKLEAIKARVLEMLADATNSHVMRNGLVRRP